MVNGGRVPTGIVVVGAGKMENGGRMGSDGAMVNVQSAPTAANEKTMEVEGLMVNVRCASTGAGAATGARPAWAASERVRREAPR